MPDTPRKTRQEPAATAAARDKAQEPRSTGAAEPDLAGRAAAFAPARPRSSARNAEVILAAQRRAEDDLRRAKDELAQANAWQRTILDSADVAIVSTDTKFVIQTFNRAAERMLGYGAGEVIALATPWIFLDPSEIRSRAAELSRESGRSVAPDLLVFGARNRDGMPEEREWTFLRKDGGRVPVRLTVTEMRDATDRLTGYMGVAADLSARKRDEERLRRVVEATPNGIVMIGPAGRIQLVNAQTERLFGYAREELIGQPIELLVPERFRAGHPGHRQAFIGDPGARAMGAGRDLYGRRKDGSEFAIEIGLNPIDMPEGAMVLSAIVDITDRKRAESELRELNAALRSQATELAEARDHAEDADRLKSAFLATMSHELRTPLNSIIGFTGILLQKLAGPLNDEQCKQLGMVRDSSRHLLSLINDVLDISKIEAGQLEVGREPFNLRASIDKAGGIIRPQIEAKGLALHVQVDDAIGAACGDQRRVEQVLLNLLSNAVKFTERGSVSLRVAQVDAAMIRIDVTDTGIGIEAQDMASLFKPFRQIDSRLSREHEGTGLGLAISQRLAKIMGCAITAASRPGKGSVFTLTLPASNEAMS